MNVDRLENIKAMFKDCKKDFKYELIFKDGLISFKYTIRPSMYCDIYESKEFLYGSIFEVNIKNLIKEIKNLEFMEKVSDD